MPRSIVGTFVCMMVLAQPLAAQPNSAPTHTREDEFSAVRCGADVANAMIGHAVRDGSVSDIERAHRDIALHDAGGFEVNDALFLGGWSICGAEYQVLPAKRIADVLAFPAHSRRQPGFVGACKGASNAKSDATIVAVLDNPSPRAASAHYAADDTTTLAARSAWRIDEARARFVKLPAAGLRCPRSQIFTVDGGP